jgi:hypothetical protein
VKTTVRSNTNDKKFSGDWRPRRYVFLDKRLINDTRVRTGVCSQCHRQVGDKYQGWRGRVVTVKQTQLHHDFYLTICPWFSRRELCVACHSKIRWGTWRKQELQRPKPVLTCSRCGTTDPVSRWWYQSPEGHRLCRRCWRNTVYGPANRERIRMLARAADHSRRRRKQETTGF